MYIVQNLHCIKGPLRNVHCTRLLTKDETSKTTLRRLRKLNPFPYTHDSIQL